MGKITFYVCEVNCILNEKIENIAQYSVLMSVYENEKAQNLKDSIQSIYSQTLLPYEVILVLDGKLTDELYKAVDFLKNKYSNLKTVALDENIGLWHALNVGLAHCECEIVARMDSDDIAVNTRIEEQLKLLKAQNADIVSSPVMEFKEKTGDTNNIKDLPKTYNEILNYAKKRNPFNHPAVIFKKSAVINAGGYQNFPFFEDYELFVRMLKNGAVSANTQKPLLYMRVGEGMYKRRGGKEYTRHLYNFLKRIYSLGFISKSRMIKSLIPRVAVSLMPSGLRKMVYNKFLRK